AANLQSRSTAAVANHCRHRAGHLDARSVRSANRERGILHAIAGRISRSSILHDPCPSARGSTGYTLGPTLSRAVAALDSNLPTYFAGTPGRFHNEILSGNRVIATLFTIFGIVAFILSAVGLYGVMSFSVSQRTQEFGIRMALGADAARIFR